MQPPHMPPPGPPQQPGLAPHQAQAQAQNAQLAAMMWSMQMQGQHPNPGMMMPPWPPMPATNPELKVRVEGLKFDYQLTEDDVKKVFARYGAVQTVSLDKDGTSAVVTLDQPHQALAAQHDLDNKQLSGMQGAFLRVEFLGQPPAAAPYDPMMQMAAAMQAHAAFPGQGPMVPPPMPGYPYAPSMPPMPPATPGSPGGSKGMKKHTCKLEVGIDNEGDFRVASRVIQIARQIWQDAEFQQYGGKTRLRGRGIGGPHEADEPLALCISCGEQKAFNKAVSYAEGQLHKVHADYKAFCEQKGQPVPDLAVKIQKKLAGDGGPSYSGGDPPRGERPPGAPSDDEIEQLIEDRNEARKAQNWQKADEVREYLKSRGVVLMDEKQAKGNLQGKQVTKWRFWRP